VNYFGFIQQYVCLSRFIVLYKKMPQQAIILFDGVCNLCNGWVRFLIKRDEKLKFRFASLQSEAGQSRLETIGLPVDVMETLIYIRDKQYFSESSAVLEILKDLGGIWKIVFFFRLIPKRIRDSIYWFIAKHRYRIFGKRSSCMFPTLELEKRFLL